MAEEKNLIESLEELKYELIPGSQLYVIRQFDDVKEAFEKAINDLHVEEILTDDKSFNAYKKRRTLINKAKEKVKRVRLDLTEAVMGTFQSQCKELEDMLQEADATMKSTVDAYTEAHKEPKPPVYTLTITSGSLKAIEKIRKTALKDTDLIIKTSYEVPNEGDKQ